jgi:glycosyltransferase involved in cell wall biosynthesis
MSAVSSSLTPALLTVSVAMITYNHEQYIRQAIEGVLKQETGFPFELVIGEDCSPDGTRRVVLDFQKRFPNQVRVITSEHNVGAHKNGHRVMNACHGKYVAFCEGDDYWHNPNKLKKQVDFLEANSDYGLVHGDVRIHYVSTGEIQMGYGGTTQNLRDDHAYLEILSGDRTIWTPTGILRNDLLRTAINQNPECREGSYLMGDTQTWLEVSRLAKVKYMPVEFATRHDLSESASRSNDPQKMLRFVVSAKNLHEHYLEKYDCPAGMAAAIRLKHTQCALYYAFKALDRQEADRQRAALRAIGSGISARNQLLWIGSRSRLLQVAVRLILRMT